MKPEKTIKVALADDHALFRDGVTSLFAQYDDLDLCLEAANGGELLEKLKETSIDVVLLDLEMEGMDGKTATEQLVKLYPEMKVLVLTMHNQQRMMSYLMEIGASGYLLKDIGKDELVRAVREVHRKGYYINDETSRAMLATLKSPAESKRKPGVPTSLTEREQEILELICREYSTKEIADKLFISPRTVEGHRQNLYTKLQVKNTVGLVIKAVRDRLVAI